MAGYNDEELISQAEQWLESNYSNYPSYIKDIETQEFSPAPVVILDHRVNEKLLAKSVEKHGYVAKKRKSVNGETLIGACYRNQEEQIEEIIYTFETTNKFSVDSPVKYDNPPDDGRTEVLITYLEYYYNIKNK